jgi:hypothetical protein
MLKTKQNPKKPLKCFGFFNFSFSDIFQVPLIIIEHFFLDIFQVSLIIIERECIIFHRFCRLNI